MAQFNVVKNESSVALMEESTEGTAVDPSGATDYIQVLQDNFDSTLDIEEIERAVISNSVERVQARAGVKSTGSTLGVELKTGDNEGDDPEAALLWKGLLGGTRNQATQTTTTGNTSTVLEFGASPNFEVGDMVVVKESGAYEVRPVSAVGGTTITFPVALDNGAPSDGVEVSEVTTFYHDVGNAPTLTQTNYLGDEIKEQLAGMRVASMSLEGWEAGSTVNAIFSLTGLSTTHADGAAPHTPSFDSALPPIALQACLWLGPKGGTLSKLDYQSFSLNVENTLSEITSPCSESGKVSTRVTEQIVSGSVNPYMDDTTTTLFDAYDDNTEFSLFAYLYNPTSTAGQFDQAIGIYLPQIAFTNRTNEDIEGIYADGLEFQAHKASGNDSIFISFI